MSTPASAGMPDFTGRTIFGRFELQQLLGSGTYGVVYRAIDLEAASSSSAQQQCAIKVLRKAGPLLTDTTQQRQEISLHYRVSQHPNVLSMHGALEDDEFFYLILDFCPGGDLFGQICEKGVYVHNDELLRKVFLQIVDAVHDCHRKKVFHRDLKPENILTNEDGTEAYLADFGLATSRMISYTFGCGSSYYMSPECIGEDHGYSAYSTQCSDVWALGIVLINMVTGRNPWSRARSDDKCFMGFLEYENFLQQMLPISKGLNTILRSIFTLNPLARITLPHLREAILKLDTFFMNEKELRNASSFAKTAAAEILAMRAPVDEPLFSEESSISDEYIEEVDLGSMDIGDVYVFSSPRPKMPAPEFAIRLVPRADRIPYEESNCGSIISTSSSEVSEGPITPDDDVYDPMLEMFEGGDLGKGICGGEDLGKVIPSPRMPTPKFMANSTRAARNLLARLQL